MSLKTAVNQRVKDEAMQYLRALLMSDADDGSVDMILLGRKEQPKIKEFM